MKGLKHWLEVTGTTQAELGEKLGIGQSSVSMLVNGERNPSFTLLYEILKVTGMDAHELVGKSPKRRRA